MNKSQFDILKISLHSLYSVTHISKLTTAWTRYL